MPRSKWAKSISDLLRVPLRAYGTLIFYRDPFCSASAYVPARNKRDLFFFPSQRSPGRVLFATRRTPEKYLLMCGVYTILRQILIGGDPGLPRLDTRMSRGWRPGSPSAQVRRSAGRSPQWSGQRREVRFT